MRIYGFLANLEADDDVAAQQDHLGREWSPELLRRAYAESPKSMKRILSLLAAHAGQELTSEDLAHAVDPGANWNNVAGTLGAFVRRVRNRYEMAGPPYETRWDADDGRAHLLMPEAYGGVIQEIPPVTPQPDEVREGSTLHLKLVRSSAQPADLNLLQNAGYDDRTIESTLAALEERGSSYEIVDIDEADTEQLINDAMMWAVFARTAIVPTFGTNKYKWQDIGARVPALFVYDTSNDERPMAVYPHKVGIGYATISSYLTSR